jgi:hypothetical protein
MGYFRDHYVLPAGIAFAVLAVTGLSLAASRSHKSLHRASVAVWIANLAAILLSSIWYFQVIRAAGSYRGSTTSLQAEMERLGVRSALVFASQTIDEHPVWSPKGDALAVNVDGRWVELKLAPVTLEAATWRGSQPIGIVKPPISPSSVSEGHVRDWERSAKFDPRKVILRDGKTVELRQEDLSTSLIVTPLGGATQIVWKSGLESCYGLAVSPDQRLVAYVCELNGVIVTEP